MLQPTEIAQAQQAIHQALSRSRPSMGAWSLALLARRSTCGQAWSSRLIQAFRITCAPRPMSGCYCS